MACVPQRQACDWVADAARLSAQHGSCWCTVCCVPAAQAVILYFSATRQHSVVLLTLLTISCALASMVQDLHSICTRQHQISMTVCKASIRPQAAQTTAGSAAGKIGGCCRQQQHAAPCLPAQNLNWNAPVCQILQPTHISRSAALVQEQYTP
jgi:hypothetical protein